MHVNSVSDAPCHCSLPIGNLGNDENFALYDIGLTRLLQKNRALTWASNFSGRPDLGTLFFLSTDGVSKPLLHTSAARSLDHNDIWGDDNEFISPIVRRPGSYCSLCVDIDVRDLAIAALTDTTNLAPVGLHQTINNQNPPFPTSSM